MCQSRLLEIEQQSDPDKQAQMTFQFFKQREQSMARAIENLKSLSMIKNDLPPNLQALIFQIVETQQNDR